MICHNILIYSLLQCKDMMKFYSEALKAFYGDILQISMITKLGALKNKVCTTCSQNLSVAGSQYLIMLCVCVS